MTLADRIVVMNAGRIEQVGTPLEVYGRPATRFVAGFIGTPGMNMLPVLAIEPGPVAVLAGGLRVALPASPPSGKLTMGIRAEHIHAGPPGEAATATATVEVVEHLGERTLVYACLPDAPTIVYDEPGDSTVHVGDRVTLAVDGAAAHLFDETDAAVGQA